MKAALFALVLLCGVTVALAAPSDLSEVQKLKAKSFIERRSSLPARYEYEKAQAVEVITKKYQQESTTLEQERLTLEADYRLALNAPLADRFDWATLTFKPVKAQEK